MICSGQDAIASSRTPACSALRMGRTAKGKMLIGNVEVSSFPVQDLFLRRMMMAGQLERRAPAWMWPRKCGHMGGGELYALAPGDEV